MKRNTIILLSVISAVLIIGFGYGCSALSYRQSCIASEAGIKAQYGQNQNNYDNMWKKFKEVAAVPKMYANNLKELWDKAMSARYGNEGQTLFRWIQEQNPTLDPAVYSQLQRTLEAGRNSFESDQKQLLDKKREYEITLKGTKSLFFNWMFKFPWINLSKYDIVTSDKTEKVFEAKKDNGVLFEVE